MYDMERNKSAKELRKSGVLERINQELKRRTRVARVFPNESSRLRSPRRDLRRLGNRKNLPQHRLLVPAYDLMPAEIRERKLRGPSLRVAAPSQPTPEWLSLGTLDQFFLD